MKYWIKSLFVAYDGQATEAATFMIIMTLGFILLTGMIATIMMVQSSLGLH